MFCAHAKSAEKKWDKKSTAGLLVGYCGEKDGFRIWIPQNKTVMTSRNVVFASEKITHRKVTTVISNIENAPEDFDEDEPEPAEEIEKLDEHDEETRVKRSAKKPAYLEDYVLFAECDLPSKFASAISSSDSDRCHKAMDEEVEWLNENNTWELVIENPTSEGILW